MPRQHTFKLLLALGLLFLAAAACRRDQEPTPTPEAIQATPSPSETATDEPGEALPLNIDWPPQVVFHSPAPGEEALLNGAITVRFDQPMDKTSVEGAFKVRPVEADRTVAGVFQWPRPDTVIFTPQSSLAREGQYQVEIDETAHGQNGRPLRDSLSFRLQTVGFLEVSQVIPADSVAGVQTDAAVTVIFNRPVAPLVATSQQAGLPQPLEFEPDVSGSGEWVSTSIYRFVPAEPLAGATTYTVRVPAGLEDITGGVLERDFAWSFTTVSPSVVSTDPATGATGVVPTLPLTITFNMPMDQASTEGAITLSPPADVAFSWSEDGRTVSLIPQPMLALETAYELTVGTSARSVNGQATLDRATTARLATVPFPAVLSTIPENNRVADRWQQGVSIQFASPMDFTTLDGRVRIEPAPDEEVDYFFDEFNYYLYLNFDLERNAEYVVTVPGDAADPYGNTLVEDYIFRFTTPGFDPLASLNLPFQVSQLSASFPSDVQIVVRNISQVDVTLHDLGLPANLLMEPYNLDSFAPAGSPLRSWSLPVSAPRDQAEVLNLPLADGAVLPTGVYFLQLSAPEIGQDQRYWQNHRNLLIVADTNLVVKEMFDQVHVWATDLTSGDAAAGRRLTLYNRAGQLQGTAVTNENGLASFDYKQPTGYLDGVLVVSNAPGEAGFSAASSQWSGDAFPWRLGVNSDSSDEVRPFVYIYTDRPIYRPGDTVYFKGLVREPHYGRYTLPREQSVDVSVQFANYYYSEVPTPTQFALELDAFGAFHGEYQIPEEADLGNYTIYVNNLNYFALERSFTVAEYRRPEFLVTATPVQEEALRGESVEVVIEASYLFGGPATDLLVQWTVFEEPFTLPWDGPYFSFGDEGGFFYEDLGPFGFFGGGSFGNYLIGGEARTDGNGRYVITVPADALEEVEAGSRRLTVEANLFDVNNVPVAARTNVVLHAAELYVGVASEDYLAAAGAQATFNLMTTDWDAQPIGNTPVEVVFYQREWVAIRDEQFSTYYTRFEPLDVEVGRETVTTNGQGRGQVSFVPAAGGTYLAVATVTDRGGRTMTSSTSLWALDDNFLAWRSDPRSQTMELTADQSEYRVGETARILIQSPFEGAVTAWVTLDRGRLLGQRLISLDGSNATLDVPIQPEMAPNVFVTVVAIRPADPGAEGADRFADVRLGIVELVVSPEQLALNVALTPQQEQFQPSDTAVYDIEVTNHAGNPVEADLSLALVDLAVLSLKPDNAPHILEAFYSPQPYRSQVGGGLFISGEGLEVEIPLEQLGLGGGGGGDEEGVSTVRLQEEEEDVRRDFPDTAHWEVSITTGADGRTSVEIPLPDSLTTWRLSSKAVTAEALVGQSSVDVITSLPLLIRPVTPRFFTVGDAMQLGAIVHNNTGAPLEVDVSLEANGLSLSGGAEQTITVPAGGREQVWWPVTVDDVAFADLTFRASAGDLRDATRPTFGIPPDQLIPVYRYAGEDIVGTAGVLDEAGRRVEAVLLPPGVDTRQGEVQIELSASLAAAVLQTLDYVNDELDYQPVCAHAVADQLLPNVATLRALQELGLDDPQLKQTLDALVEDGLTRLEALQKADGGWGWCYSQQSDSFLSAYVLFGLDKAHEAGYVVSDEVLDRGAGYVNRQLEAAGRLGARYEVNRQAFFLYVLAELGRVEATDLDDLYDQHRPLLDPWARALLALAYDLAGTGANNRQALLADLNDSVIVSATGAHWEDAEPDWNNLSSDIRGTAMILTALARLDPNNPLAANAVRWLMSARTVAHWPTGQDTAWSIIALTDWMAASGELDADYGYLVNVNGATLADGSFERSNLTESRELAVPVRDLALDDLNYLDFQRGEGSGRLYYSAHLDSFISADQLEAVNRGVIVQRAYYDAGCDPETEDCLPIDRIQAGEQVRVELTIIAPHDLVYAVVEDHFPAGAEAIDPGLATSVSGAGGEITRTDEDYRFGYWGWWYFDRIEYRDERVLFLSAFLPAGTYQYSYTLQTSLPGEYQVIPAIAREEFFPEVFGRSEGMIFTIFE